MIMQIPSKNEMKSILIRTNSAEELLGFHPELWHGPVGAYLSQN